MVDFNLTADEESVALAVENAQAADFRPRRAPDGAPGVSIRGEALRRMALNLPVRFADGSSRCVDVKAQGLQVHAATIDGVLDLENAAGVEASCIAPLIFRDCVFNDTLQLSEARLRRLSLAGSRIVRVIALGAQIEGAVDISGLRTAELPGAHTGADGAGLAWVDLTGARISGEFDARESKLVAPPKRPAYMAYSERARFALDLQGAEVRGDLILRPGFEAIGGVSMRAAKVHGTVRLDGATLTGVESGAFDATGATINGSLLLRAVNSSSTNTSPFIAIGNVRLSGAVISGMLEMSGARLIAGPDHTALLADSASIGEGAMLNAWDGRADGEPHTFPFESDGQLRFYGARIGGAFVMQGAHLTSREGTPALSAVGADIKGHVYLTSSGGSHKGVHTTVRFIAKGEITLLGAKIHGSLEMGGALLQTPPGANSLNLDNAEIGGRAYFGLIDCVVMGERRYFRFEAENCLYLSGVKIDRDLRFDGARITTPGEISSLVAINAEIGGDAVLANVSSFWGSEKHDVPFEAENPISFWGAHIERSLEIRNAIIRRHPGRPCLAVNYSQIDGNFQLSNVVFVMRATKPSADDPDTMPMNFQQGRALGVQMAKAAQTPDVDLRGSQANGVFNVTRFGRVDVQGETVNKQVRIAMLKNPLLVHLGGLRVGTLNDSNGADWLGNVRLRLDGFRYDRTEGVADARAAFAHYLRGHIAVAKASGGDYFRLLGMRIGQMIAEVIMAFGSLRPARRASDFRRTWLNLQYTGNRPNKFEYTPDPYQRLAAAFRAQGNYEDARRVTSLRLTTERKVKVFVLFRPVLWLYSLLFDYGLSTGRALATFAVLIVAGGVSTQLINHGRLAPPANFFPSQFTEAFEKVSPRIDGLEQSPLLVIDAAATASVASPSEDSSRVVPAYALATKDQSITREIPCGDQVDPWLYAFDVFIPVLDLRQETKCAVSSRADAWPWRWAKAFYAMLGWIVSSLTILTVSGVLRRQAEN